MRFTPPSKIIDGIVCIPHKAILLSSKPEANDTWTHLYRGRNGFLFTVHNDSRGLYPVSKYTLVDSETARQIFINSQTHYEGFDTGLVEA